MAKPGPAPGIKLTTAHREKIANSQILQRLIGHAEGSVEMTPTQVTAALGLLRKSLPDLTSVAHTGEDGGPVQVEMVAPLEKLRAFLAR